MWGVFAAGVTRRVEAAKTADYASPIRPLATVVVRPSLSVMARKVSSHIFCKPRFLNAEGVLLVIFLAFGVIALLRFRRSGTPRRRKASALRAFFPAKMPRGGDKQEA